MSKIKMGKCNFCYKKIEKKVDKCPHCGATNTVPLHKRWWFIGFMLLLLALTFLGY